MGDIVSKMADKIKEALEPKDPCENCNANLVAACAWPCPDKLKYWKQKRERDEI